MSAAEEQRIARAKAELRRIRNAMEASGNNHGQHMNAARAVITAIDSTGLMQRPNHIKDQIFIISRLQKLAYFDADSGGVRDIADWCVNQWLRLLQRDGQNVDALHGLGAGWLLRAQRVLARIHREEASFSSNGTNRSEGRSSSGANGVSYTSSDDARDAARATVEADARVSTADYVEARGILVASTEYFTRAIASAERRRSLTGELLTQAAEAYMSLGNVSYSYANEQYFRQTVVFLRRATQVPNYRLSPHMQNYLNDYGRFVP